MTIRKTTMFRSAAAAAFLTACASGGGGGVVADPVLDPETGTPAAPRNLVIERTSFRSGNTSRGVDETYDLSARTLVVDVDEDNDARTYVANDQTSFGTGQSMSYDASTNEFTFDIDYQDGTDGGVVMSETFGPLLLVTPKDLDDLANDLQAVYMATQTYAYAVDRGFIGGDVYRADAYITSLAGVDPQQSGSGMLATWRATAGDRGFAGSGAQGRRLGFLPVLVAQDPTRYGVPAEQAGTLEQASGYLNAIDAGAFESIQDRVPRFGADQDDYLARLLDFAPDAFGVDPQAAGRVGGEFLIESMSAAGGSRVGDLLASYALSTEKIEDAPGFFYSSDGVSYYQFRTDNDVAPTRFVAAGEWYREREDGREEFGYTVFGQKTDPSEMPSTGTATYDGTLYGAVLRANTVEGLRGGVTLQTDFATGRIDMDVDANIAYRNGLGDTEYIDYATLQGGGTIDGAAFEGTLTGTLDRDVTDGIDVLTGSYEGSFFGPTAQEAGGTFEFTGEDAAAAGSFVAADPNSGPDGR